MSIAASPLQMPALPLVLSGALAMIVATALALRPRARAGSFAWIVVSASAYPLLALAAALQTPEADGLRAAVLQLLAALLAAALGGLCPASAGAQPSPRSALPSVARGLAWLTLVGLPPTAGFHGKILIYRALLAAGWEWLTVLAMACSAAALAPALWAISSAPPGSVRGTRALAIVALMVATLVLGLYPQAGLAIAVRIADLAAGA